MPEVRDPMRNEDADEYAEAAREQRVVTCVALTAFIFQFEAFLVNVSLPDIARELHTSSTAVSMVVIAYLLAATVAFVPAGYLGAKFGMRRVFLSGCVVATLGTLLSGLSVNLEMLWCNRFVQGAGMGAMVSIGYAIIPMMVRKHRVGWGYGMLTLGAASGMVLGLPVGGLWSQFFSWHWIFLGTTPVLSLFLAFGWMAFPDDARDKAQANGLHPLQFLPFSFFLLGAVLALSLGNKIGWASPIVITSGGTATLAFVGLLLQRRYGSRPYPSEHLLKSRGFPASLGVLFVFQATVGGIVFLIPFYLELLCGLSTLSSSLLLLVYPASLAVSSLLGGRMADRIDSRPLIVAAGLLGATTCGLFSMVLGFGAVTIAALFLLLFGVATGFFFPPNNRFAMSCVTADLQREAGALLPVALNMGSVVGVAFYDELFTRRIPDAALGIDLLSVHSRDVLALLNQGFIDVFMAAAAVLLTAAGMTFAWYRSGPTTQSSATDHHVVS